ncbi:unnamed protein product [Closterium sp. Naga37s-1]|nr:unnamed protein product [Closterium sp. Naga37s-1]
MGSRGDEVALSLTAPADAENHQIVDVVDLLPGPIWHIIFRHLLLGSSSGASQEGGAGSASGASQEGGAGSASGASQEGGAGSASGASQEGGAGSASGASQEGGAGSASGASLLSRLKKKLQSPGNSSGASQEGAGSTSPGATGSGLLSRLKKNLQNWGNSSGASQEGGAGDASTTEQQLTEALRTFGACWPLLRCAMVCQRLLHHVASFPVSLSLLPLLRVHSCV